MELSDESSRELEGASRSSDKFEAGRSYHQTWSFIWIRKLGSLVEKAILELAPGLQVSLRSS